MWNFGRLLKLLVIVGLALALAVPVLTFIVVSIFSFSLFFDDMRTRAGTRPVIEREFIV